MAQLDTAMIAGWGGRVTAAADTCTHSSKLEMPWLASSFDW